MVLFRNSPAVTLISRAIQKKEAAEKEQKPAAFTFKYKSEAKKQQNGGLQQVEEHRGEPTAGCQPKKSS